MRRRWWVVVLVSALVGGPAACRDPLAVEPGDPVFELVQTGGIAGTYDAFVVHRDGRVLRGPCETGSCDWSAGEDVTAMDPAVVESLLDELAESGFFGSADRSYGVECCDQFEITLTARTTTTARTVRGSTGVLPENVLKVANRLMSAILADPSSD